MFGGLALAPEQASSFAAEVDNLTIFTLLISAFFTFLIAALILYFAIRYKRTSPDAVGSRFENSMFLEITWTAIPLVLVMVLFGWGLKVFFHLYRPPPDAVEYWVTGKQWMWKLQHPEGQREINELHIPVGQPIKLIMTSEDVIHSFFVPAFRTKADVVPGRYTYLWFEATKPGKYHIFCSQYCGTEHSRMIGWVIAQTPEEYAQWLAGGPAPSSPVAAGEQLFTQLACNTCHRSDSSGRGPSLDGVFGSTVTLATGTKLVADEAYLRESILNPTAKIVAGYQPIMPVFAGQVSEEGVLQLIAYIKSRKPKQASAPTAGAPSEGGGR